MISVVIPAYNEEKVIEGGIRQFLPFKKRYDLEIIVSDGKSTDSTVKIAKRYADKVVVWNKKARQNIPQGRNAGCFKAKGDILFVTDADCRVRNMKRFLDKIIKEFKDPKMVALTGNVLVNPKEKIFSDNIHHLFNFYNRITNLLHIGGARGEFHVIRSSAFRKIKGYDEKLACSEDYDLFYRLRKLGDVRFVPSLTVFESPRRYRKLGYPRTIMTWIYEGLNMIFTGKAPFKEWKVIR